LGELNNNEGKRNNSPLTLGPTNKKGLKSLVIFVGMGSKGGVKLEGMQRIQICPKNMSRFSPISYKSVTQCGLKFHALPLLLPVAPYCIPKNSKIGLYETLYMLNPTNKI